MCVCVCVCKCAYIYIYIKHILLFVLLLPVTSLIYSLSGEIRNVPTVLYVPILYPCLPNKRLCIAVDLVKGNLMVSLDEHCK